MALLPAADGGDEVRRVTPIWKQQRAQKHPRGTVNVLTSELRLLTSGGRS